MPSTLGEPEFAPCPHCEEIHPEDALVCPRYGEPLPLQGRLLDGKFRFMHLLGEGGMGAVWKAGNVLVHKSVAIKLMHGQYSRDEGTMARFRNEATAAGRIGNDHICDILDLGRSQLGPYIVMELLQGRSLAELVAPGQIDPGLAVLIVRQALLGLEAAHKANIIHRDLKPENLFLHEPAPGRLMVKLMDFGISKFSEAGQSKTGVGVLMGTPEYMSPEQAEGAAGVDLRTDIWAMGVILYRAITGQEAFLGPTLAATLLGVSTKEPTPLRSLAIAAPEGLEAVIKRCLAKDPADRYASASELFEALAPFEVVGSQPTGLQGAATPSRTEAQHSTPHPAVPPTIPGAGASADTVLATTGEEAGEAAGTPETAAVAPSPGPQDSWSLGPAAIADRPSSTLSEQRSSLWVVVILLVLGGVGAAFVFFPREQGDAVATASDEEGLGNSGGRLGVTGTSSSGTSSATGKATVDASTAGRTGGGSLATGAGRGGSTAGGTGAPAASSGGAADETGDAAETGAAAGGDETGGAASGTPGGTDDGNKDDGGDTGGASGGPPTSPVRVQHGKVHRAGGLFTPRTQAGPVAFSQARRHCNRLKRQKFAGLSGWRLASGPEIGRFKGKVAATRYWTRKRTAYNMFRGTEAASKPDGKARPFCVSAKR